ncbi:MAG: GAF domain-containing protein [Gemmatimonadales bacterium]
MDLGAATESADEPLSTLGSEPLVPILQAGEGQVDPAALATWHQALSNTTAIEVPHDLMGLWLYPSQGGIVLLGPEELAEDDLAVPLPSPHLKPEQLALVEGIVQNAGYASATCLPIRFGKRDVALLLVADLQPGRYGPAERVLLQCIAQRIAPMLGRIARQWTPTEGSTSRQQERIAGLLEAVAHANGDGGTPQRFLAGVTRALAPLLPHDHVELLVPDPTGDQYLRLGDHAGGQLWSDPSLIISREHLDIAGIFDSQPKLLVSDTYEDARWPRGFLTASESNGADVRSIVGARMGLGGASVAYLLVGSIGPELYGGDDLELLVLLAGLIAPQVAGFIGRAELPRAGPIPVAQPPARDPAAESFFRIASLLATTSDPATATRLIAEQGAGLFPFDRLTFAIRLAEGDRVILLEPGERRALPDLPRVHVTGTALARVLQSEVGHAFGQTRGENRLIVPLRVAGKVHGALVFSAPVPCGLAEAHLDSAQRLADIVAAHLELIRRGAAAETRPVQPDTGRTAFRALPATPPRSSARG